MDDLLNSLGDYVRSRDGTEAARLMCQAICEIDRLQRRVQNFINDEKSAGRRVAIDVERQRKAEAHRLEAMGPLSYKLAGVCFDYAERAEGRVMVRAQLALLLQAVLLGSGLHRDPRFHQISA